MKKHLTERQLLLQHLKLHLMVKLKLKLKLRLMVQRMLAPLKLYFVKLVLIDDDTSSMDCRV